MRNVILLPFILSVIVVNAQPKLVGALAYNGPQNGGSIFKDSFPSTTPGIIHSFNNLAPHRPVAGLCVGDDPRLYGVLTYNGTNNDGGLFRINKDGSGFTMLY